jgi:Ni,Fe-hydrogenase III small subunit/formate hydrogenlyase subunit 6/NADH:ubiquinone oxidoreductase subunit I
MIEWIARGLRGGIVTTRYPKRAEQPPAGFRGRVEVLRRDGGTSDLEGVCPTGAIAVDGHGAVSLDRGRCILCGLCVDADPDRFAFVSHYETAARDRAELVDGEPPPHALRELRATLGERSRTLRRSIHIRHVDAGSDGGEEWEIQALTNPYYDVQRLGFFFTLSPRHADILLVSGAVTEPMREPLRRTWETMPDPKAVVAVGTDACSGGLTTTTGATAGGVDEVIAVDVYVPGSPPSPIAILHGLLLATGVLVRETAV